MCQSPGLSWNLVYRVFLPVFRIDYALSDNAPPFSPCRSRLNREDGKNCSHNVNYRVAR